MYCNHNSLPKHAKSRFGARGPLGVNFESQTPF
jgi:hypothetical protein